MIKGLSSMLRAIITLTQLRLPQNHIQVLTGLEAQGQGRRSKEGRKYTIQVFWGH